MSTTQKNIGVVLFFLVALKASALVVVFSVLHPGFSLDAAEILYWAQELQWSGQKHPAMPAWILKAFLLWLPSTAASYYLVGQVTLLATYLFVWLLAKEFLQPFAALLATLVLACGLFYSFYSLTYNANTLSLPAWAAFSFFLWKALEDGRCRWWIALACAAAFALLTKYAVVLLFAAAGGAVLIVPKWRACLKTYKPYLAAIVVLLLTLPHWLWVVDHNFITFDYATAQLSKNMPTLFAPALYFPLRFTFGQIVNMLPVLLCLAVFFVPKHKKTKRTKTKRRRGSRPQALDVSSCHNKKVFLLTMGLIPCFVTVVLSMVLQKYVHSLWGLFYWNLTGIAFFYFLRERITQEVIARRVRLFFVVWTLLVVLTTVGFLLLPFATSSSKVWVFESPYQGQRRVGVGFEEGGNEQAKRATSKERDFVLDLNPSYRPFFDVDVVVRTIAEGWRRERSSTLSVIGSEQWLASSVSFFSPSRFSIVALFDAHRTAWLAHNREQWNEEGGVVLWVAHDDTPYMPRRYRRALSDRPYALQPSFSVPWRKILGLEASIVRGLPASTIGWAIVPPLPKKSE